MVQDLCILYICQNLDFNFSRKHYSWISNSHMTYVSIQKFGKGTLFQIPWTTLTFSFINFIWSIRFGTQVRVPMPSFYFSLNFSLHFSLNRTKRMWDRTPTTSLYVSFNSLLLPRGRGFDAHASHFFSFSFSYVLTERLWVRIPLLSF